jgi:hypothetical protein
MESVKHGVVDGRARGERSMLETALDARVPPETLRKIKTGRVATPAFPTIAAIADVLGLSLDAVWAEITSPNLVSNRPALVTTHVSGWPRKSQSRSYVGGVEEKAWARLSTNVPGQHTWNTFAARLLRGISSSGGADRGAGRADRRTGSPGRGRVGAAGAGRAGRIAQQRELLDAASSAGYRVKYTLATNSPTNWSRPPTR